MKIVNKDSSQWGKTVILAYVGKVQIGDNGELEVDAKTAKHLVDNGQDWNYDGAEAKKAPVEVVEAVIKEEKDEAALEREKTLEDENRELREQLAALKAAASKPEPDAEADVNADEDAVKEEVKADVDTEKKEEVRVAKVAGGDEAADANVAASAEAANATKKAEAKSILSSKSKGELRDLCQGQKLPEAEWSGLNTTQLREYLLGKI